MSAGSQHANTEHYARSAYLAGGKSYRLHLPPNIPAMDFWSVVVYDPQTRSYWRITGVMPRMLTWITYLLALVILVTFSASLWMLLTFPAWVLLVSVYILVGNLHRKGL